MMAVAIGLPFKLHDEHRTRFDRPDVGNILFVLNLLGHRFGFLFLLFRVGENTTPVFCPCQLELDD